MELDKDLMARQEARTLAKAADKAHGQLCGFTQEKLDAIVEAVAKAFSQEAPMLAQMALIGDENAAGYTTVRGTASVDAETGTNRFDVDTNGLHCYVVKAHPDAFYRDAINELIATK